MGSLSAYSPFVGIRCSAQLCQAVLIRQPANPHKHLMGFVSRSVEVSEGGREGVCAQVCGATTHTRQPPREGNGSPASLVFLPWWVIICQLLPADLAVGTVKVVQVIIIVTLGTALCYVRNRLFSVLCCQQHPPACPLTFDASLCIDFHIAAVAYPCSYRVFGTCKFLQ